MRQIMKSASTAIQILCVELLADYHVPHLLRAYLNQLGCQELPSEQMGLESPNLGGRFRQRSKMLWRSDGNGR